ncbi:hypothetical protein QBZ16_001341 [Prototheca wickerhamii]|uniref:Stage V sporulation protein S n=1 Tax=Prototheca wickerhamii TaxID=3111 RepID=A0AAD9MJ45_PROWI|nr:hypothetical protein QBZ16_001341 [Prototheca wickerhamii]
MGASLALYVSSVPAVDVAASLNADKLVELTVSKASKPQTVAGAIAARAREGISTTVTGIGPDAVSNACVAVCHSRIYLEDDKLDVRAVPFFEEVEKDSGDGATHRMTAVKLRILVETVS